MSRIPLSAPPDVQQAFKELHQRLDRLGLNTTANPNLKGQRFTNVGDAIDDSDLVTLRQLKDAIQGVSADVARTVATAATGSGDSGDGGDDTGTCADVHPDYSSYVAAAKATLEGMSVDLTGPCGAFAIVKLAVENIQAVDATVGLLDKPTGNHCEDGGNFYATDIIAFFDGAIYDVLGDGGGANTPMWSFAGCVDSSRYRAPI